MIKRNDKNNKIISVDIDDSNLPIPSHESSQERRVAIFDLLNENFFKLILPEKYTYYEGPFKLYLSVK